jgi:hypothetical protein
MSTKYILSFGPLILLPPQIPNRGILLCTLRTLRIINIRKTPETTFSLSLSETKGGEEIPLVEGMLAHKVDGG